jgi:hypothetical protein
MMDMKRVVSRALARWPAAMLVLAGLSIAAIRAGAQAPGAPDAMEQALAFAQCIRENGYPEFPDPDPDGGGVRVMMGGGGQSAARFRAAQEACRDLSPAGLAARGNDPERIEQLLAFAQCMRENGVSEWPDPNADGAFELEGGLIGNRNDRRVRTAMETCREAQGPAGQGIGIRVTRGGR